MSFLAQSDANGSTGRLDSDQEAIRATVQSYIDGYLKQQPDALRAAFYSAARLSTIDDGSLSSLPTAAWFDGIEAKRKNDSAPLTARHTILGVDQTDLAAVAKVRLELPEVTFTDYLTLLKSKAGWRIVDKIYMAARTGPF